MLLVALCTVGAVLGLLLRLNARDRLQTTLLGTIGSLTPRGVRDQVQWALLSGRSVVAVDMWCCGPDEIRKATARWRAGLPLGARLLAKGSTDRGLETSFMLETARTPVFAAETAPPADHGGSHEPIPAP